MDKPYKVIWKYKNNNRYNQYQVYIFVGKYVKNLDNIFKKIRDMDLFDTLISLTKQETKKLVSTYGEEWYRGFFNMYHIGYTFHQIQLSKQKKKQIIDIHGKDWYNEHILDKTISKKNIIYSYAQEINIKEEKKEERRNKFRVIEKDDIEINYRSSEEISLDTIFDTYQSRIQNEQKRMETSVNTDSNYDTDIRVETTDITTLESDVNTLNIKGGDIKNIKDEDEILMKGFYDWNTGEYYELGDNRFKVISNLNRRMRKRYQTKYDDDMVIKYLHFVQNKGIKKDKQIGGGDRDEVDELQSEINNMENLDDEELSIENIEKLYEQADNLENDENLDMTADEEFDLHKIQEMYQVENMNIDDDSSKTTSLIEKALKSDGLVKKTTKRMIDFDDSKDDNDVHEKLKDVYTKIYVKGQFIYSDDSIETVKNKISTTLKNNKKFGKNNYLLPSRQYLWSEYVYDNTIKKVSIGQKWLKRTELLDIDIEPNNKIRMYEKPLEKLELLKINLRRYAGTKIRRDDDSNNVVREYNNFMTDNDIYMIDVYNELGERYKPDTEKLNNMKDLYFKLYFYDLKDNDISRIIDYLNDKKDSEERIQDSVYQTLHNDMIMVNEITDVVEIVKRSNDYKKVFKQNYITQSTIHVNLRLVDTSKTKIDLYRIFDNFKPTEDFPQLNFNTMEREKYSKSDRKVINKLLMNNKDMDAEITKWFEMTSFGITFIVKILDEKKKSGVKYISVSLSETGRIEYKTQWIESEHATIDDIYKTYDNVRNLVEKISSTTKKDKLYVPVDQEFKFAFINTIQKFVLPEKYIINHNDLSDFSRFFYPYIALVIEPRKRISSEDDINSKSKYGTYLRYKRVSKYDNQAKLEQRIIFFMRNYEYQEKKLAAELGKQFNITEEKAYEAIDKVKEKYPNLTIKSKKNLKKLESIPKYKPPGIGIDIQGKDKDNYKVRISGARDDIQLNRIVTFMNILIYLYSETYLLKKRERQILKTKLKNLTNIAKRRSKVYELVNYDREDNTVKQMTSMDKQRLGFKPEKGQNQWTRSCQNSGKDKKRRPQQYKSSDLNKLSGLGYKFNKSTKLFEKNTFIKNGKKKTKVTLKTVRVPEYDEGGNNTGNYIHYACDPKENSEHIYAGFLTRSTNPYGHCMPCCFKKDPAISNNKVKREFYLNCLGKTKEAKILGDEEDDEMKKLNDQLYILQDSNKITDGRYAFLPKYLDRYFNFMLGNKKKIKQHYLEEAVSGYYFKFGTYQKQYPFLNAICSCMDIDIDDLKNTLMNKLIADKSEQLFTSLNNGDIKTQFGKKEDFIKYISESPLLPFELMKHFICIPNVVTKHGLNLIIFRKKKTVIKKTLEKDTIFEDFYLDCVDMDSYYNINNPNYTNIILIQENNYFHPIVKVSKIPKLKNIEVEKIFFYENNKNNIINHITDFYKKNCFGNFLDKVKNKSNLSAKRTYHILKKLDKKYHSRYQFIDIRNKCKFLITNDGFILPVQPSGCQHNVQIIKSADNYINDMKKTIQFLEDIYKKTKKEIPCKPIGLYFDMNDRKNSRLSEGKKKLKINAIMTKSKSVVPIKEVIMTGDEIKKMGYIYERKPSTNLLDIQIEKGADNIVIDDRILQIKKKEFEEEGYQLFRLEFSEYINDSNNAYQKTRIVKVINSKKMNNLEKVDKIRLIMYRIVDKNLYQKYLELIKHNYTINQSSRIIEDMKYLEDIDTYEEKYMERARIEKEQKNNQIGGKINKLIYTVSSIPDILNYEIENNRHTCAVHKNKDDCSTSSHCKYVYGNCMMSLTPEMIIKYINSISEELAENSMKCFELLKLNNYYVSDIVNRNNFKYDENQIIIKDTGENIKRQLKELFGTDDIPIIGKKSNKNTITTNYEVLNINNPMIELRDNFVQRIINNNISYFRAYANGFYWLENSYFDLDSRNLGFYNPLQTRLANRFKSVVIDYLTDSKNEVTKLMKEHMGSKINSTNPINEYIQKLAYEATTITTGITEFIILSKKYEIPIIIRNSIDKVIYIFKDGILYEKPTTSTVQRFNTKKSITLRFEYNGSSTIPTKIENMYSK